MEIRWNIHYTHTHIWVDFIQNWTDITDNRGILWMAPSVHNVFESNLIPNMTIISRIIIISTQYHTMLAININDHFDECHSLVSSISLISNLPINLKFSIIQQFECCDLNNREEKIWIYMSHYGIHRYRYLYILTMIQGIYIRIAGGLLYIKCAATV